MEMEQQIIEGARQYFRGMIGKHRVNAANLLKNPVGIGEHGDIIEELEKEIGLIADYEEKLQVLEKYFTFN